MIYNQQDEELEPIMIVPFTINETVKRLMNEHFDTMKKFAIMPWYEVNEPNLKFLKDC